MKIFDGLRNVFNKITGLAYKWRYDQGKESAQEYHDHQVGYCRSSHAALNMEAPPYPADYWIKGQGQENRPGNQSQDVGYIADETISQNGCDYPQDCPHNCAVRNADCSFLMFHDVNYAGSGQL